MKPKAQSQVAKSLEKIALEKGLVAPKKYAKVSEAASQIKHLTPGDDFNQNVIKLCNALRDRGFNKYADDVESKFLQYKSAQYNVVKETGEDLIEGAHPEGSPKLPDMEGDATIENILEKHKKIKQIMDKQPTGKLAAKDAINVAKILLAQTTKNEDQLKDDVKKNLKAYKYLYTRIKELADRDLTFLKMRDPDHIDETINDPTVDNIGGEKSFIENMQFSMRPSGIWGRIFLNQFGIGEVSKNTWDVIKGALSKCLEYISNAKDAQDQVNAIKSKHLEQSKPIDAGTDTVETTSTAPLPQASPEAQRLATLLGKVQASTKFKDDAQKGQVQSWLGGINQKLNNPQTADQAKKELMDAEKSLAPYI